MILALLRWVRDTAQRLLERLDPVAETPTIPPPEHEWSQLELYACRDMTGVDRVLARWRAEGAGENEVRWFRAIEEHRRFLAMLVNSRGGVS